MEKEEWKKSMKSEGKKNFLNLRYFLKTKGKSKKKSNDSEVLSDDELDIFLVKIQKGIVNIFIVIGFVIYLLGVLDVI